ncbi:MAG: hypothetical protein ACKO97_12255, partial [Actinomycetota bacterium]
MNVTSPLLELPLMAVDRERVEAALRSAVRTPDAYLTEIASHLTVVADLCRGNREHGAQALAASDDEMRRDLREISIRCAHGGAQCGLNT